MFPHGPGRAFPFLRKEGIGDAVGKSAVRFVVKQDKFKGKMRRQSAQHWAGASVARVGHDPKGLEMVQRNQG